MQNTVHKEFVGTFVTYFHRTFHTMFNGSQF